MTGSGKKAVGDGERASCGLRESVVALPGVGAKRAEVLARMGIHTLGDLLTHAPRRYEDRQRITSSVDAEPGMAAVFVGEVMSFASKPLRGRSQRLFEAVLQDTGGTIRLRWWQGAYLEKAFAPGRRAVVYGKPASTDPLVIDHPDLEWWDEKPFIPEWRAVYPSAQGLTQKLWRQWVVAAQQSCAGCWREPLPDWDPRPWPKRCEAIAWLHWPQSSWAPSVARARLALDEWIDFRLELSRRRALRPLCVRFDNPIEASSGWSALFQAALPFEYTRGQRAVLEIVGRDLFADRPMRRLLQGDVGSGKTAIAAAAAVMVLEQGYDVTLMAPTEALARQHYLQLRQWMETLPVKVELVVGGGGAEGDSTRPTLFVGTSALLHRRFDGRNLGLNIIDEQHRFGVAQRVALGRKDPRAHMLAMTATPIPRTLAMTIFADLESTELREVPPGRGPGATYVRGPERMEAIYDFVRQELDSGRQAFFVFPRIEADDTASGGDALEAHYEVIEKVMKPFRTGKAHGAMANETMLRALDAFAAGKTSVLVATTVIEVGVNVPNASVMVILGAERFGLAQLHQLRGRVRRGGHTGRCILVTDCQDPATLDRLHQFCEIEDGFAIAELDWRHRGSGVFLGKAQSGKSAFRFADPIRDAVLAEQAKWLVERYGGRE